MKLDCLLSCSQLKEKEDEKSIEIIVIKQTNKQTNKQSKMGHK